MNNQDLLVDMSFHMNFKNKKSFFEKFEKQINNINNKYSKLPIELIGHSKGHYIAYTIGDKFSINTTGFNSTFGKDSINYKQSNKIPKHNFFRITDDIASYNVSIKFEENFKLNKYDIGSYDKKINKDTKNQWKIFNLHPLQTSVTYLETHYISNFTENELRKTNSSIEDSKTKVKNQKELNEVNDKIKNSLLYDINIPEKNLDQDKIIFKFSDYKLYLRNNKISLYNKKEAKIYNDNEFILLAKKKSSR